MAVSTMAICSTTSVHSVCALSGSTHLPGMKSALGCRNSLKVANWLSILSIIIN